MLLLRAKNAEWCNSNCGEGSVSIKETRRGSTERRCLSALSISPSADKGLMIWGKTLDDFGALFRRFLEVVVVVVVIAPLVTVEADGTVVSWVCPLEDGVDESFRIFCGRIGILEGLEGFGGSSTGESDTRLESELGKDWGWGGVWISVFVCTWVCSPMSAKNGQEREIF